MANKFREGFKEMVRQIMNKTTRNAMGVDVIGVDFGKVKVPEAAQKQLLDKWLTDWSKPVAEKETEIAIIRGKGEVQAITLKEVGQAEAKKEAAAIDAESARIEAEAQRRVARIKTETEAEKAQAEVEVQRGIARIKTEIEGEKRW